MLPYLIFTQIFIGTQWAQSGHKLGTDGNFEDESQIRFGNKKPAKR